MKIKLTSLILSALTLLGANIALANSNISVKEGVGYVYEMDYDDRQGFHNAAKNEKKEDSWLCFDNECHDIGFLEGEIQVMLGFENVVKVLETKKWHGDVYWRHIHIFPPGDNEILSPSELDIIAHSQLKRYFKEKFNIDVISEVFDGKGYWTFDSTINLESKLQVTDSKYRFMFDYVKIKIDINNKYLLPREEKIKEFILKSEKQGVHITYTSLE